MPPPRPATLAAWLDSTSGWRRYATTALGSSEVNLLELANAYRTLASGTITRPHVIRKILLDSGEVIADGGLRSSPVDVEGDALSLIQEGLRGVVRIPGGTAHALDSGGLPFAVMGKTGTTNEFRDALFLGSTYGPEGITVAVRIGFDDNRSLRANETGGRVALSVFREIVIGAYGKKLVDSAPRFPAEMERRIDLYLKGGLMETTVVTSASPAPLAALPRGVELFSILMSRLWPFQTVPRRLRSLPWLERPKT